MKMKKVSGIFMAMCIVAGSGAVEASKGIDYYLIKDNEKLIHMSIEDYANNFSNTSSNYYQHFLKNKYLEIEYIVKEQGKSPKIYSDDKYVYINDFLKNKNSNLETDKDVLDRTNESSFAELKDKLYKLSFNGSEAIYEKLIDELPEEKINLKEGKVNKIIIDGKKYIGNLYQGKIISIKEELSGVLYFKENIDSTMKFVDDKGKEYSQESSKKILDYLNWENSGYMISPINMTELTIVNKGSKYRKIDFLKEEQGKYNNFMVNREILELGFNSDKGDVIRDLKFNPYSGNSKYHFQGAELTENILGTDLYRLVVNYKITHDLSETIDENIYKFDFYIKDTGEIDYTENTEERLRILKDKIEELGSFEVEDLSKESGKLLLEELKGCLEPSEIKDIDFELIKFVDQVSDGKSIVRISKDGFFEEAKIWVEVVNDIDKILSRAKEILEEEIFGYLVDGFEEEDKVLLERHLEKKISLMNVEGISLELLDFGKVEDRARVKITYKDRPIEAEIKILYISIPNPKDNAVETARREIEGMVFNIGNFPADNEIRYNLAVESIKKEIRKKLSEIKYIDGGNLNDYVDIGVNYLFHEKNDNGGWNTSVEIFLKDGTGSRTLANIKIYK